MQAVRVKAFGGVDQLEMIETPDPIPGPEELLVHVKACGLNYADVVQREGLYPGGPKPPYFAGAEAAGIVKAYGPGASTPPVGARVAVIAPSGMHAEHVVVKSTSSLLLPESMTFSEGAAFPIQYLTAYHSLTTVAHAVAGETVLIHAAAGGVGTAAVQIAKLLGLRVVATASTAEKRARLRHLNADSVADYDEFEAACRAITSGHGPDLILETVGGEVFRRSLSLLPPLGRLVVIGIAGKQLQSLDTVKLLFRSQGVMGFHLSSVLRQPQLLAASLTRLLAWFDDGRLKIQIGHTLPLSEIRRAHELLASRQSYGKIVLIP
jgi:NADPH2:quinone reductase